MSTRADSSVHADTHTRDAAAARAEEALVALLRRARARFAQVSREVDPEIEAAAYGIMHLIDTGQAATVTEVAAQLAVGKPTVSRQVSALETLGLVRRGAAADDRRAVPLVLTTEGRARLAAARARRAAMFRSLTVDWTVEDLRTLGDLLTRLNELDF